MKRDDDVVLDLLVALEAEYASVLGQSAVNAEKNAPTERTCGAESVVSDSEDEESTVESYMLLPSSPHNSDANSTEVSSDFEDDTDTKSDASLLANTEVVSPQNGVNLHEDNRAIIMQSMKQVKLRPPPWAEAFKLTDDELVDMVRQQLRLKSSNKC